MPKRETFHSRLDFFGQNKQEENEAPEEHWRKLVTLEQNCEFSVIKQDNLPKVHHQHYREKITGENIPRKNIKPQYHHGLSTNLVPRQLRRTT